VRRSRLCGDVFGILEGSRPRQLTVEIAPSFGFGGAADPLGEAPSTSVLETYPVLTMIALGWTLPDAERPAGRLPKYNPERRKTFAIADWAHVCRAISTKLAADGAAKLATWAQTAATSPKPRKSDQDRLDAELILRPTLRHPDFRSVLDGEVDASDGIRINEVDGELRKELQQRCAELGREAGSWVRVFRLPVGASTPAHGL